MVPHHPSVVLQVLASQLVQCEQHVQGTASYWAGESPTIVHAVQPGKSTTPLELNIWDPPIHHRAGFYLSISEVPCLLTILQ